MRLFLIFTKKNTNYDAKDAHKWRKLMSGVKRNTRLRTQTALRIKHLCHIGCAHVSIHDNATGHLHRPSFNDQAIPLRLEPRGGHSQIIRDCLRICATAW